MSNWNQGTQREQPPVGAHVARLFSIIDIGTQVSSWQGKEKRARKVVFSWELPEVPMTGKYDPAQKGKPFAVSCRFTRSLRPSSALRDTLKTWKGRDFTKEELEAFDPKKLLGKSCQVILTQSSDGQYINVDTVIPLANGQKCPVQVNPNRYLSLDPDEFDQAVYASLPEGFRKLIADSPEFAALTAPGEEPQDGPPDEPPHEEAPPDDDRPF